METVHDIYTRPARNLPDSAGPVHLVVTSPPYPMIEMWDEVFASLDSSIKDSLEAGDGWDAFDRMHEVIDRVWSQLADLVCPGGIVCINIGDATRTLDGDFTRYPNAAEITTRLVDHGFTPLPTILWRKPTNSPTQFMGSGTAPPNAYPTLEHERILVFRKGGLRSIRARREQRYESCYFREERNQWFSDLWEDISGTAQTLAPDDGARSRSGAYPLAIPRRLIQMFSIHGDTVYDPFWGTGTTSLAALLSARSSIGCEIDPQLVDSFTNRLDGLPEATDRYYKERLRSHREFIQEESGTPKYESEHYDMRVKTSYEQEMQFYTLESVTSDQIAAEHLRLTGTHAPYTD